MIWQSEMTRWNIVRNILISNFWQITNSMSVAETYSWWPCYWTITGKVVQLLWATWHVDHLDRLAATWSSAKPVSLWREKIHILENILIRKGLWDIAVQILQFNIFGRFFSTPYPLILGRRKNSKEQPRIMETKPKNQLSNSFIPIVTKKGVQTHLQILKK